MLAHIQSGFVFSSVNYNSILIKNKRKSTCGDLDNEFLQKFKQFPRKILVILHLLYSVKIYSINKFYSIVSAMAYRKLS